MDDEKVIAGIEMNLFEDDDATFTAYGSTLNLHLLLAKCIKAAVEANVLSLGVLEDTLKIIRKELEENDSNKHERSVTSSNGPTGKLS